MVPQRIITATATPNSPAPSGLPPINGLGDYTSISLVVGAIVALWKIFRDKSEKEDKRADEMIILQRELLQESKESNHKFQQSIVDSLIDLANKQGKMVEQGQAIQQSVAMLCTNVTESLKSRDKEMKDVLSIQQQNMGTQTAMYSEFSRSLAKMQMTLEALHTRLDGMIGRYDQKYRETDSDS